MACQSQQHWNRRTLLTAGLQAGVTAAAATSMSWLTPLATKLAHAQERAPDSQAPAKSVILLWMQAIRANTLKPRVRICIVEAYTLSGNVLCRRRCSKR